MGRRLDLHNRLVELVGDLGVVYFQPPTGISMSFPCIVYHRDYSAVEHANDNVYFYKQRYLVTVIDRNPDSELTAKVATLPMCTYNRYFAKENLNHDNFYLYF